MIDWRRGKPTSNNLPKPCAGWIRNRHIRQQCRLKFRRHCCSSVVAKNATAAPLCKQNGKNLPRPRDMSKIGGNFDTSPDATVNRKLTVRLSTFGLQLNPRPTPVPTRRAAPCSLCTFRPPPATTAARPRPYFPTVSAVSGRAAPNRRAA